MDKMYYAHTGNASAGRAISPATPSGPVGTVLETLRLARDVADRASHLVGRLCGHTPTAAQGDTEAPNNGVLYDLAAVSDMTRQRLISALDELARLENTIGG